MIFHGYVRFFLDFTIGTFVSSGFFHGFLSLPCSITRGYPKIRSRFRCYLSPNMDGLSWEMPLKLMMNRGSPIFFWNLHICSVDLEIFSVYTRTSFYFFPILWLFHLMGNNALCYPMICLFTASHAFKWMWYLLSFGYGSNFWPSSKMYLWYLWNMDHMDPRIKFMGLIMWSITPKCPNVYVINGNVKEMNPQIWMD